MTWLRPGSVVGDRYLVEELLGEGGMGVVLAARHQFTGERVALKMLHTHLLSRPDLAARFLAEARAPAAIGHPGIVRVLDAGTTEKGEPYFAMERLEGEPLSAPMRRGPMPFEEIRRIGLEILDALGAAHAAGFIHRDLKPENVFLCAPEGRVKLLDFGIAKSLGDMDAASHTATGATMGTLHYMSPEQLRNAKRVDHRTDLWAVGVILYQMLAGQLPYVAESMGDMLLLVLSSPPRPLEERLEAVSPALAAVMARALAVDPNARFASAAEMAAAMAELPALSLSYRAGVLPDGSAPYHPVPPTMTAAAAAQTAPTPSPSRLIPVLLGGGLAVGVGMLMVSAIAYFASEYFRKSTRDENIAEALAAGSPCALACKKIEECGAVFDREACMKSCDESPPTRECVRGADCAGIGACFTELYCGKKPTGALTCAEVAHREGKCAVNDKDCVCRAMQSAKPSEAGKVVVHNSCAFTRCRTECMGIGADKNDCAECYRKECRGPVAACSMPK